MSQPLVIVGAGGYAQEVLWVLDDLNAVNPVWDFLGFIDPGHPEKVGQMHYDRPILGGYETVKRLPGGTQFVCGIGSARLRRKECDAIEAQGLAACPALIHPSVILARHVEIGAGTILGAGSIVAPNARVGRHCALNLHVTVGHDSHIGDYCVLSPGARVSGHAVIEDGVFVGSNATIYLGRRVGSGASVGANSFLLTDLRPGLSAIGIPARSFAQATEAGTCAVRELRQQ